MPHKFTPDELIRRGGVTPPSPPSGPVVPTPGRSPSTPARPKRPVRPSKPVKGPGIQPIEDPIKLTRSKR